MNVKGRTLTLVANFERLEQRGRKTAVRLLNVRRSTGELIAARGWFAHTEAFGWLGLVEGDVVQFDAFTETAYQGERTLRLADPVHLKKLPFDLWRGLRPGGPPGEAAPEGAGIGRSGLERLTERERQVLALLVNGHGNGEIARQLGLSAQTASNYVSAVYGKLNVSSRAELAVWAREHDLSVPT